MEEFCPCCGRHCPVEQLSCPTGKNHFGVSSKEPEHYKTEHQDHHHHEHRNHEHKLEYDAMNPDEKIIVLLRQCGHFLHHSFGHGGNTAPLLDALTPDEKTALEALLEKCLESWQVPQKH